MQGIRQSYILKGLSENPVEWIRMVCINNPRAVQDNLRSKYGIATERDDYDHLFDQVVDLMRNNPQNAKNILMDVCSVGIDPNNVTAVGQDVILDKIISNQKR